MKKIKAMLLVLVAFNTNGIKAQDLPWTTSPLNVPTNIEANLGTFNDKPLFFVTRNAKMASLDTGGTFRLYNLAGSGNRLLYVDGNGNLRTVGGIGGNSSQSVPCLSGSMPWYEGGNTVNSGNNVAGTCNNVDFVLKANNAPLLYLKNNKKVGVGPGNSNPSAQFDVSDGNNYGTGLEHTKIWGDNNGVIQTTSDLNLSYNGSSSGTGFYIGEGLFGSSYTPKFAIINGNVGIGTGYTANTNKFTVNSGTGNGIFGITSNNSAKMLAVYNTSSQNPQFEVLGNGITNVGNQPNQLSQARLNLNVASPFGSIPVIDVFDQTSGANGMVNFRVNSFGFVYCRELHVLVNTNTIPDFVFNKDYKLLTIKERAKFIQENGHLPHLMSAKEIEAHGNSEPIGKMVNGILQNTEELTLYLIQLNEKIEKLAEENRELKKAIEKKN
ncbi:MAG: hypothetical protein IT236_04550 [Bacteroidia bacterium]|nr:hypothetical protein [Bacteroidia bacterium]